MVRGRPVISRLERNPVMNKNHFRCLLIIRSCGVNAGLLVRLGLGFVFFILFRQNLIMMQSSKAKRECHLKP